MSVTSAADAPAAPATGAAQRWRLGKETKTMFKFTGSLEDALRIASSRSGERSVFPRQNATDMKVSIRDGDVHRREGYTVPNEIVAAVQDYVLRTRKWKADRYRVDYLFHKSQFVYLGVRDKDGPAFEGGPFAFVIEAEESSAAISREMSLP